MRPAIRSEHSVAPLQPIDAARCDSRLLELIGTDLRREGYSFTAVTPATHEIVLDRANASGTPDLRDVFGWNRSFLPGEIPSALLERLRAANALDALGERCRSRVRYASLDANLFVHSGYPTLAGDSVFFGPDSYRFVRFIRAEAGALREGARVIDIGCGTGVAGIDLATRRPDLRVVLADVNDQALQFAAINARIAGVRNVEIVASDVLASVDGNADLIVANPPYMADVSKRIYRDGGDLHGAALSLRIVEESVDRLAPGGRLLLYTGSAIVGGRDRFGDACRSLLSERDLGLRYEEIDPDVFGDQLLEDHYRDVERIAAVGLIVNQQGSPS